MLASISGGLCPSPAHRRSAAHVGQVAAVLAGVPINPGAASNCCSCGGAAWGGGQVFFRKKNGKIWFFPFGRWKQVMKEYPSSAAYLAWGSIL